MSNLVLQAEEKGNSGTGTARALRRDGKIPAVAYGFGENRQLSVPYKEFFKEYSKGKILSTLIDLEVGKKKLSVIPLSVQVDPVTDRPMHIDFQMVKKDVSVQVKVGIKITNKDLCQGIKRGGALNIVKKYLLLHCLPKDIPTQIEIDIAKLVIGDSVHINDIKMPSGVEVHGDKNFTLVTIAGRVEEKEEANTGQQDDDVTSPNPDQASAEKEK